MTGNFGGTRGRAKLGLAENLALGGIVRNRSECLIQLLGAFHDIADFDDIHQAAQRLDAVQAWIRREARDAAADPIFDDESADEFHVGHATA